MEKVEEKFLRYVSVWTTSDPESKTAPSAKCEFDLLNMLADELHKMGINATISAQGVLMATVPANLDSAKKSGSKKSVGTKKVPTIGFIAHVDTAPDASGKDIKPQIIKNYDGKDILLNKALKLKLSVKTFPEMKAYKGHTIITTDGTTLLGTDDKAGVAEIMCAAEYMMEHKEFKHGEVKIAFTPDEEIGCGVDHFSVKDFGAQYAYTLDGGAIGELEYENFNAASAKIEIQGCNIHPGYAKGKMINAMLVGNELINMLPPKERPEHTSGHQGFFHLTNFNGTVESAKMSFIIRDHDIKKYEERIKMMKKIGEKLNKKYGKGVVKMEIKNQYYNMKKIVEPKYFIVKQAIEAMKMAGVKPIIQPIRGGTDGAMLSFRGLPCPNLFAGGHNFHGKLEYVPVESMEKAVEVVKNIITLTLKS
ncbi:MAG TPA: peptidase T [Candidatus Egerieousia sp.]|nr:peptidase T [Candidatus Egerieousia sp.]HPT05967.1 peptidase T [Candidatus Egerieousia sp.]